MSGDYPKSDLSSRNSRAERRLGFYHLRGRLVLPYNRMGGVGAVLCDCHISEQPGATVVDAHFESTSTAWLWSLFDDTSMIFGLELTTVFWALFPIWGHLRGARFIVYR